ncbi:MAG: ATP-binding protein [Candidatus Omnitrophica bacterium]|nr:ATP-binding protein [Candidatus Omnitrophota bacterium]
MNISVASGKGGTGKTTVAVNLALSINNVQFLDCDVEEPNAHLFIKPHIKNKVPVFIPVPEIDKNKCDFCGKCAQVCAYNAIAVLKSDILVFKELCHGCGSCSYFCPQKAIKEVDKEIGFVEIGTQGNLQFIHGRLNIGEAMSPPLIRAVKQHINSTRTVIIDVPPGTSCPVIEAIKGSDFCILVTEPTPFGLYDLTLAVEVLRKLKIPFGAVINRSDLGNKKTDDYCKRENIPILMRIPFKKEIASAYSKGEAIVKAFPEYKNEFQKLFDDVKQCRI